MAAPTTGGTTTKEPLKLAEDFATWYSGVTWTWKPKKVKKTNVPTVVASLANKRADLCEHIKRLIFSSQSPRVRTHQTWESEFIASVQAPSPTKVEISPLLQVRPYFEIRLSSKGGYGAFALQDIPAFTVILSEPYLIEAKNAEILDKFENLSQDDKETFLRLASFDELDTNKVIATFKTNRFQISGGTCGIFPIASRFNHACYPLCDYIYDMEIKRLILTTTFPIPKDQEITISYGQTGDCLFWNWGFICDCGRCSPTGKIERW